MVYITSPIPCFAELTMMEMDWFNGSKPDGYCCAWPIIKAPVVAYRCVDEGWIVTRLSPAAHLGPFPLDRNKRLSLPDHDAIFFKVVLAAAEFGNVTSLQSKFRPTRTYAILEKKHALFIAAAHKLLSSILAIHPQARREKSYVLYNIATVHETKAAEELRNGQDAVAQRESLAAARCYHNAAICTQQFYPNRFIRGNRYCSLAFALLHVGYAELAKRSFLWALSDAAAWLAPGEAGSKRSTIIEGLGQWWEDAQLPEQQRKQAQRRSAKYCGKLMKKSQKKQDREQRHYSTYCLKCKSELLHSRSKVSFCSRCQEPYCSRKCQEEDWLSHKATCKQLRLESKVKVCKFEQIGGCTASSKDLLAAASLSQAKHSMALAEGARMAAEWERNQAEGTFTILIPPWLCEKLEEQSRS